MTKIRFILMVVVVGLFAVGCENEYVSNSELVQFKLSDGTICYSVVSNLTDLYGRRKISTACNWKGN